MGHPALIVLGYSEASMLLRQASPGRVRAVISIVGCREHGVEGVFQHRLDLRFDDTPCDDGDDPIAAYRGRMARRRAAEQGLALRPPTRADAQAIVDFAASVAHLEGAVLCRCGGGISRAPAAALLCLATWAGPGNERACVECLREVRPAAVPHEGLIRLGDEVLGRNGVLVAAMIASRNV